MATPIAAGAAAIMMSALKDQNIQLKPLTFEARFLANSSRLNSLVNITQRGQHLNLRTLLAEFNNPIGVTTRPTSHPTCTSRLSDPDGDGFGWENNKTCIASNLNSPTAVGQLAARHPTCASRLSDPDGDGFGWENNKTCIIK